MSDFLRTPDSAFAHLPGYSDHTDPKMATLFAPHYTDSLASFEGIRVHYLDGTLREKLAPSMTTAGQSNSGQVDGSDEASESPPIFLCIHGNPSWSYLYRKMVPIFAKHGRVIAPDLIGFGRSDKPIQESWHSFSKHRAMLLALVEQLDLTNITLVVQDWGGLFGLTLPMEAGHRYKRLIVMNTGLATGKLPSEGFIQWRAFSNSQPDLNIGKMLKRGKADMTDAEAAAYNAPYPDASYKAAIRAFPNLVPDTPEGDGAAISRQAARWWANETGNSNGWQGQSFMAIGMQDPVLGPVQMASLRKLIRGCPEPLEIAEGGHFVQEWGDVIALAGVKHFAESAN
jgi:haloalkane dehalogenase